MSLWRPPIEFDIVQSIPETEHLYRMKQKDIEKFAECANRAYAGYPLFEELSADIDENVIRDLMRTKFGNIPDGAVALSTGDDVPAVSLFLPPGTKECGIRKYIGSGGSGLLRKIGRKNAKFLLDSEEYDNSQRKRLTGGRGWYLEELHVDPRYRGRGLSSKLLYPMLEYLGRIGETCYLETHKKVNVEIYNHFGFGLMDSGIIPGTSVRQYAMIWRPHD